MYVAKSIFFCAYFKSSSSPRSQKVSPPLALAVICNLLMVRQWWFCSDVPPPATSLRPP